MIAIIAEKPSVGQDIARVVGATEKMDGYITGNGYMVTWALGHLVSLALPGTYGYTRTTAEDLPMIPEPFRLVPRQIRTDRGMVTDIAAGKQLKIIDEVFSKCDSIIVATDAGREGELIFRWIYSYLGYTKPFRRLWISSLTDEAIREGMANLREGSGYDSLYAAADSRAKADWLVGMNASRALATASGSANNSIGRVQTPTLAMICARFKENRNFVSTPYWQLHIALKKDDVHRQFFHPEDFRDKNGAEAAYRRIIYLYESVKGMMVADAELTGTWEKALAQIEGHTLDPESFMLSIREYTGKVTGEILRLKFPEPSSRAFTCPKCKTGNVIVKAKVAKCDHEGCGLLVFRRFLNKELTDQHLEQLFSSGSTRLIKGVKGKKGASFDAAVAFDADFNLKLSFPKPKGGKGK